MCVRTSVRLLTPKCHIYYGHGKWQKPVKYIRHPYEDELTAVKAKSFFRLNFDGYTDVDNKERARTRDEKQRRRISLEEKHEKTFPCGGDLNEKCLRPPR